MKFLLEKLKKSEKVWKYSLMPLFFFLAFILITTLSILFYNLSTSKDIPPTGYWLIYLIVNLFLFAIPLILITFVLYVLWKDYFKFPSKPKKLFFLFFYFSLFAWMGGMLIFSMFSDSGIWFIFSILKSAYFIFLPLMALGILILFFLERRFRFLHTVFFLLILLLPKETYDFLGHNLYKKLFFYLILGFIIGLIVFIIKAANIEFKDNRSSEVPKKKIKKFFLGSLIVLLFLFSILAISQIKYDFRKGEEFYTEKYRGLTMRVYNLPIGINISPYLDSYRDYDHLRTSAKDIEDFCIGEEINKVKIYDDICDIYFRFLGEAGCGSGDIWVFICGDNYFIYDRYRNFGEQHYGPFEIEK